MFWTSSQHLVNRIWRAVLLVAFLVLLLAGPVFGQQQYVSRFDLYGGYGFLESPHVKLFENGFATQFGVRPKTWLSLGFDYTIASGNLTIVPSLLLPALQTQLNTSIQQAVAAGAFPPPSSYNYPNLSVPAHSRTQTFAVGPELINRHYARATIFVRPVYAGIIHETATPQPQDPVVKTLVFGVPGVPGLLAGPTKTDSVGFIGFGGGFDILFSRHFAWRTQADLVHDHLFNDLLKDARFTLRFSCGPAFNFGRNIRE